MRKLFLIFLLLVFLLFGGIFYLKEELNSPKDKVFEKKEFFKIEKGESFLKVAKRLEKEGFIKSKFLFLICPLFSPPPKILAGKYEISSKMTPLEIFKKFQKGETAKIKVVIPEGKTQKEISEILKENHAILKEISHFKVKDFQEDFEFLKKIDGEFPLEGFLFPDTYFFEPESNEKEVVKIMLKNFEKKAWPWLSQKENFYSLLILASLVEKEVKTKEEKELVAGILLKRLKNKIPLQVDATITFLTGKKTTKIPLEALQIDSPYNTYRYLGLPPTPICNPGLESILAVLFPKESDFWYYLSAPDGKTYFSKSFQEHLQKKQKYLK